MPARWRVLASRIRGLFGKPQAEREFDDEMETHLRLLMERYVRQGMKPDDAAWAARRQFGNTAQLQEEQREMRTVQFLETFWRDLRFGARQLRLNPLFASIAVLSLALGIGANTAIFELVNAVRLRSLPVEKPEQLGFIEFQKGGSRSGNWDSRSANFTSVLWENIRDHQQPFQEVASWSARRFNLADGGEIRWAEGLYTSGNFFHLLGIQPMMGRTFDAAESADTCTSTGAVISYRFWQQEYGGASDVLERKVRLNGYPFPIVGVTPASFFGVEVGNRYDVALPLCADLLMSPTGKGHRPDTRAWWLSIVGRLKPGWTVERASADIAGASPGIMQAGLSPTLRPDDAKRFLKNKLEVKEGATGVSGLRGDYEQPLWLLLGTAGMVLLIACVNLANLMLARASVREREIAVRQAIGASRSRLMAQLMSESLLLAAAGAGLGVVLAQVLSRGLVAFLSAADNTMFLGVGPDFRVLGFTAAVALVTCILFGLAPALRATRVAPSAAMRGNSRGLTAGRERYGLRRALVVAQMALSLVLLVGALLFVGSLRKLMSVDPGFRSDGVLAMDVDFHRANFPKGRVEPFLGEIRERLAAQPGVTSVAQVSFTPVSGSGWNESAWAEGNTGKHQNSLFNRVSPGYFGTMKIPMVAGRDFNDRDAVESTPVAIVNRAFAKTFFGDANPVGRNFLTEGNAGEPDKLYQIVGLVGNTKYYQIREEPQPIGYFPATQDKDPYPGSTMVMRSGLPSGELTRSAKSAITALNGSIEIQFTVLTKQLDDSLLRDRLMATLAGAFGILAGGLAALGLYGVVSFMVARRRNEIGIRIALGADRAGVVWLVLREAAMLLGFGLVVGGALALWAGQAAAALLFTLKPNDVTTLLGAMALLAVVAAIASYFPARRAARLEPMQALREE